MKKKILVALGVIVCIIAIGVFVLAGKGFSPSVGLFLRTDNGNMIILDNSPIVMSTKTGNDDMFEKYESGDKLLVIHDGIQETYPGGTGVYFSIKLADGHISDISETVLRQLYELGWTSAPVIHDTEQESESVSLYEEYPVNGNIYSSDLFDVITVRSRSIFDTEKIKLAADNSDFMNDEDNYHFSVFAFDTYESFSEFLDNFDKDFNSGHSHSDDFREGLKDLNEDYFKDNAVILVSYYTGSGNVSYNVENVYFDGNVFRLNIVKHTSGNVGTCDITYYFKAVGVEKTFLGDCSSFDAVLVE